MLKKELKAMIKNPAHLILLFMPFVLTFFMSEGTKDYLLQHVVEGKGIETVKEVVLYQGNFLTAQIQFATSELSFMLMMSSILIGMSVFEERRLHVWNRLIDKERLLCEKFILYYLYDLVMIALSLVLFYLVYGLCFPFGAVMLFCSIPLLSLCFGILIGLMVGNRTMLSNIILMVVMLLGYFGGALSLTSVLANTKLMNMLMYLSPLTVVNKLIFRQLLQVFHVHHLLSWIILNGVVVLLSILLLRRRIKNGAIL